jgi:excinuclease ABC subunit A
VCHGKRFNEATLRVQFKGKNIAEVLDMSVHEAMAHFEHHREIQRVLQTLDDVGLGYIKLGQPSPTLSGGEAQRIKLSRELARVGTGRTMYILDEPTTGLHFEDVKKLLHVLDRLVEAGNTVVVIEHNLDVIKCADWIIDLGPEGGEEGGRIIAEGTPEEVAQVKESFTGHFLAKVLSHHRARRRVAERSA